MLAFLIIITTIIIIGLIIRKRKSKLISQKKPSINFEDIDSLNVSKIVTFENDIDFTRNELWYQYKQKQKINTIAFYKLKHFFENENGIKIPNASTDEFTDNHINTLMLIETIISDQSDKNESIKAFIALEKQINLTIS